MDERTDRLIIGRRLREGAAAMPPLFRVASGSLENDATPLAAAGPVDQSTVTGIPDSAFAVRIVSEVLTLATLGAGVRCVVRIS